MVTGIIILNTGLIHVFGNPKSLTDLIEIIEEALPQLRANNQAMLLDSMSKEQLQQLLAQKESMGNDTNTNEQ